jgi:hypothetical protein
VVSLPRERKEPGSELVDYRSEKSRKFLIFTEWSAKRATISNSPPIASMNLRSVLTYISARFTGLVAADQQDRHAPRIEGIEDAKRPAAALYPQFLCAAYGSALLRLPL